MSGPKIYKLPEGPNPTVIPVGRGRNDARTEHRVEVGEDRSVKSTTKGEHIHGLSRRLSSAAGWTIIGSIPGLVLSLGGVALGVPFLVPFVTGAAATLAGAAVAGLTRVSTQPRKYQTLDYREIQKRPQAKPNPLEKEAVGDTAPKQDQTTPDPTKPDPIPIGAEKGVEGEKENGGSPEMKIPTTSTATAPQNAEDSNTQNPTSDPVSAQPLADTANQLQRLEQERAYVNNPRPWRQRFTINHPHLSAFARYRLAPIVTAIGGASLGLLVAGPVGGMLGGIVPPVVAAAASAVGTATGVPTAAAAGGTIGAILGVGASVLSTPKYMPPEAKSSSRLRAFFRYFFSPLAPAVAFGLLGSLAGGPPGAVAGAVLGTGLGVGIGANAFPIRGRDTSTPAYVRAQDSAQAFQGKSGEPTLEEPVKTNHVCETGAPPEGDPAVLPPGAPGAGPAGGAGVGPAPVAAANMNVLRNRIAMKIRIGQIPADIFGPKDRLFGGKYPDPLDPTQVSDDQILACRAEYEHLFNPPRVAEARPLDPTGSLYSALYAQNSFSTLLTGAALGACFSSLSWMPMLFMTSFFYAPFFLM